MTDSIAVIDQEAVGNSLPQAQSTEIEIKDAPVDTDDGKLTDEKRSVFEKCDNTIHNEATKAISNTIKYFPVNELKLHPLNESIYGRDDENDLVRSIATNGILNPILITSQKTIVSGHRRHAAAKLVGLKTVPTVQFHTEDELEIKMALVEANRQRVKTNEQIGREFNMLVEVEQERAKTRKKLGKPVTHGDAGKTRDVVASKIGDISGISAARAGAVVSAIDKLGGDENTKAERDELRELLNNNISGAHAKAIADGHIETHAKKGAIKKAASRKTDAVKYEPLPKEADQDEADTPHAADENTIMFLKYEEICDYLRDLEPGVLTKLEKDHWIDANNEIASLLEGL